MFENFVKGNFDNYFKLRFLGKYLIGHKGYIAGGCFKNIFNGEKAKDIDVSLEVKKTLMKQRIILVKRRTLFWSMKIQM